MGGTRQSKVDTPAAAVVVLKVCLRHIFESAFIVPDICVLICVVDV